MWRKLGWVLVIAACSEGPAPAIRRLASGQDAPSALAMAEGFVYWTNLGRTLNGDGLVARVSLGGGPVEVLATGQDTPNAIVVGSGTLLWANESIDAGDGAVLSLSLADRALSPIATSQGTPNSLALAGGFVYWNDLRTSAISRAPEGGGSVEVLTSGQLGPKGMALMGDTLYWYNYGSVTPGMVRLDGAILAMSLSARQPMVLAGSQRPVALAVDEAHAYWVHNPDEDVTAPSASIVKLSFATAAVQTLVEGLHGPSDSVLANGWLYYSDANQLARVSLDGGAPSLLATAASRPLRLAAGAGALVWSDGEVGGAVSSLALP